MSQRQFSAYVLCLTFLFAVSTQAQSSTTATSVTEYVKAEMRRQKIPGLSLLVAKGGHIVQAEGFGLANVELQAPVKPESIFQSGSVGKQFTATAVMMLVEESKIGLDDPLTEYFPDAPASWKEVTVRQVAESHRGLRRLSQRLQFPQRLERRGGIETD